MRLRLLSMTLAAAVFTGVPAQALYKNAVEERRFWPRGQGIPVCWAPGINPESSIPRRIRAEVEAKWGRYSSIFFEGWGNCPAPAASGMPGQNGIFIQTTSSGPGSVNFAGRIFASDGTAFPTTMKINFNHPVLDSLCNLGPGGNSNEDCVAWTAIHEFGHALGFLHEHARPDFNEFPSCQKSLLDRFAWFFSDRRAGGGTYLTTYDGNSVMNYCPDSYNQGRLTTKDIAGLQEVYGMKPAGSIVGAGGRCADVDNVNGGEGSAVQLWHCWGGNNQRWQWGYGSGTFSPDILSWACLDDESGGQTPGTLLDIWGCGSRALPRWNYDQFYIKTIGDWCLDISSGGASFVGCGLGKERQWTYTVSNQLKRFTANQCLTFGSVNSQPTLSTCDPNRWDQKIYMEGVGRLRSAGGLCLAVQDNVPYAFNTGTKIRMAQCAAKQTQQFYFSGFMKTPTGMCMTHAPTDISRNGVRLSTDLCIRQSPLWEYHFR